MRGLIVETGEKNCTKNHKHGNDCMYGFVGLESR